MPIERPDLDQVTEADLQELLTAEVPEGPRIEFKRDAYGSRDQDKREALKDISSFANTAGGHLIIGIEEADGGVPAALRGLRDVDVDQEILRLEQLVRSGIEPGIQGVRTRAITLASGERCIVNLGAGAGHIGFVQGATTSSFSGVYPEASSLPLDHPIGSATAEQASTTSPPGPSS